MQEGWLGDNYLILFSGSEAETASQRYALSEALPRYMLLGIAGWDDFIVRDSSGRTYRVPTVPLDPDLLTPFDLPDDPATLQTDVRFTGKIKWYVKPIVFGGDPDIGDNLTWVTHEQHAPLVAWWNQQYRALKPGRGGGLET